MLAQHANIATTALPGCTPLKWPVTSTSLKYFLLACRGKLKESKPDQKKTNRITQGLKDEKLYSTEKSSERLGKIGCDYGS